MLKFNRLIPLFLALFLPVVTLAQGVVVSPQTALKTVNGATSPIAGATITVCVANTSGLPCSPAMVGVTFKDAALSVPLANPFTADANGNYNFAIANGTYTVTVTASGFTGYSYQLSVTCPPAGPCSFTTLTTSGLATLASLSVTGSANLPNLTATSPVINGTPSGTGIGTLTLKKGTGAGNYTTASTSYVHVGAGELCLTVTIPVGWKLGIQASGNLATAVAAVSASIALSDNAACSTDNAGLLTEQPTTGPSAGVGIPFSLNWAITGDGASHNVALQFKTSNAGDAATLGNGSATFVPTMTFLLMPSN